MYMKKTENFDKILIYQYGKVGSSSIRFNCNGIYIGKRKGYYPERVIQTHSHEVAKDILLKHKNILIINIVRLPVERNLSAFWERHKFNVPYYRNKSIYSINHLFNNMSKHKILSCDDWMVNFFKTIDIDPDRFGFDKSKKSKLICKGPNKFLFFRFEDWDYIEKNVLPNYGINIKKKINISSKKEYSDYYLLHKKIYKLNESEISNIRNSVFLNKFYTSKTIEEHIKKWI